ncbi:hypothetical protein ACQPZZ_03595 [Microbispora sp. CA-135349]|uniref:hypothetical protein n=1 Tax=Microbispora sp. CA-135349 TaxID=3239953 RepID=UPI003D8A7C80
MRLTRCAVVLSAVVSLSLAVAACGTRGAGTSAAAPTPASTPAGMVIVDKDQVLTRGAGEGEGSAQALFDAIAAAVSPEPVSPEPTSPEPGSREPTSPKPGSFKAGSPGPHGERPDPTPSVSQTFLSWVLRKGEPIPVRNPGTGGANPRLLSALLTEFGPAYESDATPGAALGLPAPVLEGSQFVALRMMSSPLHAPSSCGKWTSGMWTVVLRDFDQRGVWIAATKLQSSRSADPLVFGESIVTGPAAMLEQLADTSGVESCRKLRGSGAGTGAVEPFPVPPLGVRSFAFRITGSGDVPVWQWVEVVQTSRYVLEIRIPNQFPEPRTDPAVLLPRIAEAAYARAEAALA